MQLISTRERNVSASFEEAIFTGLAPDGGLFQLQDVPDLKRSIRGFGDDESFLEIATRVATDLLSDELEADTVASICAEAFPFSPKLSELENRTAILELFHGPSCAFKDFGASFLATTMEHFLSKSDASAIILTATSGDTGSAVAQAFHGRDRIDVVVLYPSGRVSPLQEQQLTTVGDNVHALEVDGAFDDCQRMVKEAFLDPELKAALPLTSANSINIGRLLPQAFYYVWAAARYPTPVTFCVPSGNFGNLTAGVMAWQWGMPASGFIAATNINDVVPEYLETAIFAPRSSKRTHSNAMDVGDPSNFERLSAIFGDDHHRMTETVHGAVVNDAETLEEIRRVYSEHRRFVCPHTAVGVRASRVALTDSGATDRIVTLATAHPAKFGEVIEEATGEQPDLPERLAQAMRRTKTATKVDADLSALKTFLFDCFVDRRHVLR